VPINRNAALRYGVLDTCFRNHFKKYYWEDLAIKCAEALNDFNQVSIEKVSRRTIFNDISFMKSEAGYRAPIVGYRDGAKKYYRYSDRNFSIYNQPLTVDEIDFLKKIYDVLSGISGRVEYQFLKSILPKLEIQINSDTQNYLSYEENPFLRNNKQLGNIFMAIKNRQVLNVIYKPFDEPESRLIIHPYFLKQYNNRWFLLGLDEESKSKGIHPVNLAIDRMESIENSDVEFIHNDTIDFSTYFDDIIGVTKNINEKLTQITFKVTPTLMNYLKTKPLHKSQEIFTKSGDFYISNITVYPNYELFSTLLSFGSDLIVIKPLEYRNQLLTEISKMKNLYNKKETSNNEPIQSNQNNKSCKPTRN